MFGFTEDSLPIEVEAAFAAFSSEGAGTGLVPCLGDATEVVTAARTEDGFLMGVGLGWGDCRDWGASL